MIATDWAMRRRFMIAAVRLAANADPARLDDTDLFDLFAAIGEPDFDGWAEQIRAYEERRGRGEGGMAKHEAAGIEQSLAQPLTHREFDGCLRRQRAVESERVET